MDAFDPVSLRLFVAICEEQSLTDAAFRENLTVSAVSKRLLLLEQQVGAALVERGRGGVQLTAAGEALLPAARGLLESMARIRANLSGYAHRERDHVRVACTPTAVTSFAPRDIADFLATHPRVNVKLDEHMATEVVRLKVDDEQLLKRVAGRFAESGRPDDNPESFKVRLSAYNDQTAPLLPYYQNHGKLVELDGMGSIDDVAVAIDKALDGPRW